MGDGVVLLDEVLHDGAGFEEVALLGVGEGVRQGGDAAVGVDRERTRIFFGVWSDVDSVGFVRDTGEGGKDQWECRESIVVGLRGEGCAARGAPEYFKSDGDCYAIRSLGGVEIDIGYLIGFVGFRHGSELFGQSEKTR